MTTNFLRRLSDRVLATRSPRRNSGTRKVLGKFRPGFERLEERDLLAAQLLLSASSSTTVAGVAQSLTVRAVNGDGSVDSAYTGTLHFTSTDPLADLPADATLSGGTGTFSMTLKTAGMQSITATDAVHGLTGSLAAQAAYSQPPSASGGLLPSAWYAPDGLDGDTYVYDSFVVPTTTSIPEVDWLGGYGYAQAGSVGGHSPVYDFTISIYSSIEVGTQPNIVNGRLARFTVGGNANETPAGTFGGTTLYSYSYVLPRAFQAVGGTKYWIQIEASQGVTPFYYWPPDWGLAKADGGNGSYFRAITGGTNGGGTLYQMITGDAAFTLLASGGSSGVSVTPAPVDPVSSTIDVAPDTVASGSTTTVTLTACDAFGNREPRGGANVSFGLGPDSATGTFGGVSDNGDGTYTAAFTAVIAGTNTITATMDGVDVGSTPLVTVTPGTLSLVQSTVTVSPSTVALGATAQVTLITRDAQGNQLTMGGYPTNVIFHLGSGSAGGTFGQTMDEGNGVFSATFTATASGDNTITASIFYNPLLSAPTSITVVSGADPLLVSVAPAAGQSQPVFGDAVFDVVFSRPVSDFSPDGVILGGTAPGSLSASVAGSGAAYQVTVRGMTGPGDVTLSIPAGAAHSRLGIGNDLSPAAGNAIACDPTTLDVNGDGRADPMTDGMLILRYLFDFRGASLVNGVVSPAARYASAAQIEARLSAVKTTLLDVDGSGGPGAEPLTDGMLTLRYLFGFRGTSLVVNSVSPGAARNDATSIAAFLNAYVPPPAA